MVGVAQLVEHWVVASVVVGSSPIIHPIIKSRVSPAVIGGINPFFISLNHLFDCVFNRDKASGYGISEISGSENQKRDRPIPSLSTHWHWPLPSLGEHGLYPGVF